MKKKGTALAAIMSGIMMVLSGCDSENPFASGYQTIRASQAHQMMEDTTDYILLDVRTQAEYDEEHIKGAILLPDADILTKAETLLPDKDAVILVYCRSGRRSADAARTLAQMGYTQVYDFGGISSWPYETVR